MKENEKRVSILVEEGDQSKASNLLDDKKNSKDRLKKPLIFGLMAIVFLGCMYLIFKPSKDKKEVENIGLNDAVPQATGAGMPDSKGKAYEQEMLEQKDQEKRNALTTLSDYWNEDSSSANAKSEEDFVEEEESNGYGSGRNSGRYGNPALNSYRNTQSTLGSFYNNDNAETMELRRQLDELKEKLADKDVPKATTVDDQLALMEKSYQMAAKYLPQGNSSNGEATPTNGTASGASTASQKEHFVSFTPTRKNTVSALYREPTDSEFLNDLNQTKNRGFYTAGSTEQVVQPKNSIKPAYTMHKPLLGKRA